MTATRVIEDWLHDANADLKSANDPSCRCDACRKCSRIIALAAVAKAADELRQYQRALQENPYDIINIRQALMWAEKLDSALRDLAGLGDWGRCEAAY
jgi:hypothetical protein